MTPLREVVLRIKDIPRSEDSRLLAEMVVRVVEERARALKCMHLLETGEVKTEHEALRFSSYDNHCGSLDKWWIPNKVLSDSDFNITLEDFKWLKGKVDG